MKYTCSTVVKFMGKFPLDIFGKEEKDKERDTGYKR